MPCPSHQRRNAPAARPYAARVFGFTLRQFALPWQCLCGRGASRHGFCARRFYLTHGIGVPEARTALFSPPDAFCSAPPTGREDPKRKGPVMQSRQWGSSSYSDFG